MCRSPRHLGSIDAAIDTIGGPTQRELFVYLHKGATLVSAVSPPDEGIAAQHQVRGVFFVVSVSTGKFRVSVNSLLRIV